MTRIISARSAFPEHRYSQKDLMQLLMQTWPNHTEAVNRLSKNSGVQYRNFVLPLERYRNLGGLAERNEVYIDQMLKILERAMRELQEETGFDWKDLAVFTSTSITGIAVPSLEARLMNKFPVPSKVKRMPLFGLGCLGGIGALNRTSDLLKTSPTKLALVVAAEACSLTFQFNDKSMANMVSCSLFGDGAAAVLLAGEDHPLSRRSTLKIVDTMASFYPQTERVMGWDVVDSGFQVILSGSVPEIVRKQVGPDVADFLSLNDLSAKSINNLISHPGGPKVLKALAEALEKDEALLEQSWRSLSEQGNMSSVSVLNVLERSLREKTLRRGHALGIAMGPAFNSELTLFKVEA